MKNWMKEAAILAVGMILLGLCVRSALTGFKDRDRFVTVKGLAEMEVPANKVTWPLMFKDLGDDLPQLYDRISAKNKVVVAFLKAQGITDKEITINAPEIIDMAAERYNSGNNSPYRYNITSVITVTSNQVDKARHLMERQVELLKQGIALTSGDYRYNVVYEYTDLNKVKPKMVEEATRNAREVAQKFAKDSDSELGKIKAANQGLFTIADRDANTPYIKSVRVVTSLDYFLED